ncbi:hypothetical protein DO70_921 [Burkholderia pseudomallei]|nr:hypothetical protein DO70_921 [Burkholderia pseudomallei]KGV64575.1 hypothetical protein X900_5915 [Burkholderia pseudomallei BDU 2]KGX44807.1 hypothetical protein Y600_4014 [Burkholderia pseudomallei MSHR3709]
MPNSQNGPQGHVLIFQSIIRRSDSRLCQQMLRIIYRVLDQVEAFSTSTLHDYLSHYAPHLNAPERFAAHSEASPAFSSQTNAGPRPAVQHGCSKTRARCLPCLLGAIQTVRPHCSRVRHTQIRAELLHQVQEPQIVCQNPCRQREDVAFDALVVIDDCPILFRVSKFAMPLQFNQSVRAARVSARPRDRDQGTDAHSAQRP